jgi:uncharacterized protein
MEARVGLLTITLCIPEAQTLKDKRQVVRSLLDRVRDRFNAAAAEVESLDNPRHGTVAFSCVSNDGTHVREMLEAILRMVEGEPRAEVEGSEIEIL